MLSSARTGGSLPGSIGDLSLSLSFLLICLLLSFFSPLVGYIPLCHDPFLLYVSLPFFSSSLSHLIAVALSSFSQSLVFRHDLVLALPLVALIIPITSALITYLPCPLLNACSFLHAPPRGPAFDRSRRSRRLSSALPRAEHVCIAQEGLYLTAREEL
jgi:hypothetical protein